CFCPTLCPPPACSSHPSDCLCPAPRGNSTAVESWLPEGVCVCVCVCVCVWRNKGTIVPSLPFLCIYLSVRECVCVCDRGRDQKEKERRSVCVCVCLRVCVCVCVAGGGVHTLSFLCAVCGDMLVVVT